MALCPAGPGCSSKGWNSPQSFFQILPATFWRTVVLASARVPRCWHRQTANGLNALGCSALPAAATRRWVWCARFEHHRPRQHRFGRWSRQQRHYGQHRHQPAFKVVLAEEICDWLDYQPGDLSNVPILIDSKCKSIHSLSACAGVHENLVPLSAPQAQRSPTFF